MDELEYDQEERLLEHVLPDDMTPHNIVRGVCPHEVLVKDMTLDTRETVSNIYRCKKCFKPFIALPRTGVSII